VDGVVSERLVSVGALVGPTTPIATLVPPALELVVNVEESHLGKIEEGQPVSMQVAAYPERTFEGRVISIAPTIEPKSRTASVRVAPVDDDLKLRAGMLAKLSITTGTHPNALLVPRGALMNLNGKDAATMVIESGNRVRKMPVQLGLMNDQYVEIVGGLKEGQLVVTGGLSSLSEGDLVAPQLSSQTAFLQ
jgi:RND family efflux transporter MFP subunit